MADLKLIPPLSYPKFGYNYTEFIGIGDNGHLWIDGCDSVDLAAKFGTPLFVISENQLRHNFRRFRDAFLAVYTDVEILFANKSNNSLAVRHIMNSEGAGGDCFGYNEMYLALLTNIDRSKMVLNGSNKVQEEIELAVTTGVCINLDAVDEVDLVWEVSKRVGVDAEVGIRVKLELADLANRFSTGVHHGSMTEIVSQEKWGLPYDDCVELVKRIRSTMPNLKLTELHFHLSRLDNKAIDFAVMAREMVRWAARLKRDAGWLPTCLDLGGGWTFGRKEKTGPREGIDDETVSSFEEYAVSVTDAVRDECAKHDLPLPKLRIEPGRAISGTAGIGLGRVGATKNSTARGLRWVNVDLSGNHIPWITIGHHYHIISANKVVEQLAETANIVGPLCTHDVLGRSRQMPRLVRGDLVAVLDVGCYAESLSANFNAQCRPATVLVRGNDADITTERERLNDVIGRFRVPPRLQR